MFSRSGRRGGMDPSRPITTLKTAWTNVRKKAKVSGRWHDARHTLITELAESGAGDQTIMDRGCDQLTKNVNGSLRKIPTPGTSVGKSLLTTRYLDRPVIRLLTNI